ncbi:MAG: nuoJ [Chloroflexi bacterium]|nr:nuoJ [Chloroflexota bacterium]
MIAPTEALVAGSFYTFAAIALAGAIGVVLARKVFHSALFLVLTLASLAATFVILGADFLGAVQIVIYVGAITVLILFGIMLTPRNVELPESSGVGRSTAGVFVAAAVFIVSTTVIVTSQWPRSMSTPIPDRPTTEAIGQGLFTTYALPFEMASILLLIAMIGAIVIAREEQ